MAVLVGQLDDPNWKNVFKEALAVLLKVFQLGSSSGAFKEDDLSHRRGNFAAMAVGVSFGGGQKVRSVYLNIYPRLLTVL